MFNVRGRKIGNDTLDVANKGCFDSFDTLACFRASLLTAVAAVTLIFVILKLVKYHVYRHRQVHHYVIFYVSAIECLVCGTSFMLGNHFPQVDFAACFLKLFQFTLICHLHWSLAARSLHREDIVQHVINPALCLYVLYCTTVALMGMVDVTGTWTECMRPYWLMLSSADFAIVQIFIMTAVYISHRIEGISSLICFKNTQKRDLWSVIIVYEISAVVTVAFDVVMRFVGSEEAGCSALFAHTQLFYSTTISIFLIAKFLVPIWTLLYMLQPIEGNTHISEVALASRYNNMDGNSDVPNSIRGYHHYHRMFMPGAHCDPGGDSILRLPFVSDFASLHPVYGEYPPYPEIGLNVPAPPLEQKKPALGVTGLSTISEESGNALVLDSPMEESPRCDSSHSDTSSPTQTQLPNA
ncbi:uncharacterized protein [Anabrus simplex]|uniref:uncharacterized protein n=1 Tax=Anabrus simplex TaxID=316456 RepID=UPI0035A3B24B